MYQINIPGVEVRVVALPRVDAPDVNMFALESRAEYLLQQVRDIRSTDEFRLDLA